jgi:hypothetical protein
MSATTSRAPSWHRARRTRMLTAYQFTFLPSWGQKAETLMHWEP